MTRAILDTGDRWKQVQSSLQASNSQTEIYFFSLFSLNTAETNMTDTSAAGQTTITGERMNLTGTRIESPGMDAASLMVCTGTHTIVLFSLF